MPLNGHKVKQKMINEKMLENDIFDFSFTLFEIM
jgi:hypothetical protein